MKHKEMYDENPDKYREQAKQYRINNPEPMKQKDTERHQRHKEKTLAHQKEFLKNNLELM